MTSWAAFEAAEPELAGAGRRLLVGSDGVAIGFLATVGSDGRPHLAPVCPIFCGEHLYLSVGARTPKRRALEEQRRFVLHAFLGANDEEFQIAGDAEKIVEPAERAAVHEAIPFGSFDHEDPIFRLELARCLWCWWENVGQADTRAVRRRWRSA